MNKLEGVSLKELVKDTLAEFIQYRDGDLWYRVTYGIDDEGCGSDEFLVSKKSFDFPIPIADTGTGIFPATIKAITLLRWVRKHLEKIQSGKWQ